MPRARARDPLELVDTGGVELAGGGALLRTGEVLCVGGAATVRGGGAATVRGGETGRGGSTTRAAGGLVTLPRFTASVDRSLERISGSRLTGAGGSLTGRFSAPPASVRPGITTIA